MKKLGQPTVIIIRRGKEITAVIPAIWAYSVNGELIAVTIPE